ncbi:hypothetical protein FRC06_000956 [Ceratobasidium sp. 370]|nr:hypothetical protein FRC06_000956 [Ceratobasidium sp. 370]
MGKSALENDKPEFDARDASSLSLPAGAHDAPETVADTGEGKLKMIIGLIKKCLGVKDIATMRISLPASVLEPIPNLEYWNYLDRPDVFAAIGDSDDQLLRMLAVLRFTFTKDLKFVHGKICKPYNSVLGEHFRSHTSFTPLSYPSDPNLPPIFPSHTLTTHSVSLAIPEPTLPSETASVRSTVSTSGPNAARSKHKLSGELNLGLDEEEEFEDAEDGQTHGDRVRVVFLTEQVSHHPPISSYYITAPERGIEACGVDQIAAKVAGTTVRVTPGSSNKGIFIKLNKGSECVSWTKVKQVPPSRIVATFDGTWRGMIKWKRTGETESRPLIDLANLAVMHKHVRPIDSQLPNESHRLWEHVTKNLLSKNYSEATRVKQGIEQKQRDDSAARKAKGEEFVPVYFEPDISNGQPVLTTEGRRAVEEELALAAFSPLA